MCPGEKKITWNFEGHFVLWRRWLLSCCPLCPSLVPKAWNWKPSCSSQSNPLILQKRRQVQRGQWLVHSHPVSWWQRWPWKLCLLIQWPFCSSTHCTLGVTLASPASAGSPSSLGPCGYWADSPVWAQMTQSWGLGGGRAGRLVAQEWPVTPGGGKNGRHRIGEGLVELGQDWADGQEQPRSLERQRALPASQRGVHFSFAKLWSPWRVLCLFLLICLFSWDKIDKIHHFRVYSSIVFITVLCNHHRNLFLFPKLFHYPKHKLCPH